MPPVTPLPAPSVSIPALRFSAGPASCGRIPSLHGIYRVRCVVQGLVYVGQAFDLARRALEHQVDLRERRHTNTRLQAAYNKYGPRGFVFEVLEIWTGSWRPDCLSPAEQRWMDLHGAERCYNMRRAGSDAWLRVTGPASSPRGKSEGRGQTRPLGRRKPQG